MNFLIKKGNNYITSVQDFTLKISNMRTTYLYKIRHNDNAQKLERYQEFFVNGEVRFDLEKSSYCTNDEIIELMNNCKVMKWDGFHGKHPKNVSDGTMFSFTATVNDGQIIRADGSQNFPKGYCEFVRALDEMLSDSK